MTMGFKTYNYMDKDGRVTPIVEATIRDQLESKKMYFVDPAYINYLPPKPPKKLTLKDHWKEFKDRIYLAIQVLRHGRDYLD